MSDNIKWVTDVRLIGRTLIYTPSPNFMIYIMKKFAGQFSKNKRIKKKQIRRFMDEMLDKALDNLVRGIRERHEDKA